jgi:hypothetical protein
VQQIQKQNKVSNMRFYYLSWKTDANRCNMSWEHFMMQKMKERVCVRERKQLLNLPRSKCDILIIAKNHILIMLTLYFSFDQQGLCCKRTMWWWPCCVFYIYIKIHGRLSRDQAKHLEWVIVCVSCSHGLFFLFPKIFIWLSYECMQESHTESLPWLCF